MVAVVAGARTRAAEEVDLADLGALAVPTPSLADLNATIQTPYGFLRELDPKRGGSRPLAEVLIEERLTNLPPTQAMPEAARVVTARPSARWADDIDRIISRFQARVATVRRDVLASVTEWNRDPRKAAQKSLQNIAGVRARLAATSTQAPQERWAPLAAELDPRLVRQDCWPALASLMQDAHAQGHDVVADTRMLVAEEPLGELPAQDLRDRLAARLDVNNDASPQVPSPAGSSKGAAWGGSRLCLLAPTRPAHTADSRTAGHNTSQKPFVAVQTNSDIDSLCVTRSQRDRS